jgi:hypothetical protein
MALATRLHRWGWLVLLAGVGASLTVASLFVILPLRADDKTSAARSLVAWIVEGRPLSGWGEPYPDAKWMTGREHFLVVCDFLPAGLSLSDDPRVQRVTAKEADEFAKKHRFDGTAYMAIELKSESGKEMVLEFSNVFSSTAGHWYRFEFSRIVWGLRARGKLLSVA